MEFESNIIKGAHCWKYTQKSDDSVITDKCCHLTGEMPPVMDLLLSEFMSVYVNPPLCKPQDFTFFRAPRLKQN